MYNNRPIELRRIVLLVEDDPDLREFLQDHLEGEGYDVYPAAHGKQAIEFLTAPQPEQPVLVVLDLMMPIVSGWEVLQQIRQLERLDPVPVLVITAATNERPAGAAAILTKPFDIEAFDTAVAAHRRTS